MLYRFLLVEHSLFPAVQYSNKQATRLADTTEFPNVVNDEIHSLYYRQD